MERIHQSQKVATGKVEEFQKMLDAKGFARFGLGIAAGLMFFVFCPMSIVAVAATYWTYSAEVPGATVSAKASLWKLSLSTELGDSSSESEMDMCSDEMSAFDDCGKIGAVRFFLITALLLSLASGCCFALAFSPKLKAAAALRRKMSIAGMILAAVVLFWDFLGVCLAASIDMTDGYSLNGAGFVFLVLELFVVTLAIVLAVCTITRWSAENVTVATLKVQTPTVVAPPTPSLLTTVASVESSSEHKANTKVNNFVVEQDVEATA